MRRKLLSTIGYNSENQLVYIKDTKKGEIYHCPQCGERIVARNSGKDQKRSKRPHFAHLKKSKLKCNGESILRHLVKTEAMHLLEQHLERQEEFNIQWACNYCNQIYNKNLLKKVRSLATDIRLDEHTPDIVLLDKKGKVRIAIDIIIRQKLTRKIIQQYEEKGIVYIEIHPTESDARQIGFKLQHPDKVGFCSNPECYNYQFHHNTIQRVVFPQLLKCKTCGMIVDGYMVKSTSPFGAIRLENLTETEKKDIVSKHFKRKKVIAAPFVIYGKCKCSPYSKSLQYVQKKP